MSQKRQPLTVSTRVKCRDCIFHTSTKADFNNGATCQSIGIKGFAKACKLFTPKLSNLTEFSEDSLVILARIARDLSPSSLRILSHLFAKADQIQKHGYKWGQPVYFNLSAPHIDYLDCFFKGYIVGIAPDGDYFYLVSSLDLEERSNLTYLTLQSSSVLTRTQFKIKRKELKKANKLKTPLENLSAKLKVNVPLIEAHEEANDEDTYDVPTIDAVPKDWLSQYENRGKKKSRSKKKPEPKLKYHQDDTGFSIIIDP